MCGMPLLLIRRGAPNGTKSQREFCARDVADMGQRLSSRPGPIGARWVPDSDFFRLWFEMRVAAGAARAVMLICEGWIPRGGFFAAPGPRSQSTKRAPQRPNGWLVLIATSRVPCVTRRRPPPPYRTGCVWCGLSRVVGRPPRRSTRARGRPRRRRLCASSRMPRRGAPSGGAAGSVRATRSRSRLAAGLSGGA